MTPPAATADTTRRQMLASCLHGSASAQPAAPVADVPAWVALAGEEGVVSLLQARFQADPALAKAQPVLAAALAEAAHHEAWVSIAFEGETRRILSVLQAEDLPALMLKGSALAYWAYAQAHHRSCSDIDLLLASRGDAEALSGALVAEGCERHATSGDLVAYELLCTREMTPQWRLEVDVHWQLTNSPLFSRAFTFEELMADSIPLPQLAPNARGLGPVHALLHAAMHRALNLSIGLEDKLKWLYDFVVLTRGFSEADWARTVSLAAEKALAGVTLNALEAAAKTFALALPADALVALREAAVREPLDATRLVDWRYMQAQTVRALPGLSPKVSWMWQRLFPSRDYMRYLYGDQGSFAGLLRERARRAWRKWQG